MDRFKKQRVMKRLFAIVATDAIVLAVCEKDEELEHITGFTYFENVHNAPKSTFNANDWL